MHEFSGVHTCYDRIAKAISEMPEAAIETHKSGRPAFARFGFVVRHADARAAGRDELLAIRFELDEEPPAAAPLEGVVDLAPACVEVPPDLPCGAP